MKRIILASASPRRRDLLSQLGLRFEVRTSSAAEEKAKDPVEAAERAALAKAQEVAQEAQDAIVIGADTVVVVEGRILGKPADAVEAATMLGQLSGKGHEVVTGVAVVEGKRSLVDHEQTSVLFRRLSSHEIEAYLRSGEGMDKAGAYGIQALGALLVEKIEGSYSNVVGLPLAKLYEMLKQFGVDLLGSDE